MTEAFRAGAHRIYAECGPRYEAPWRLLKKAGMQREIRFRQNILFLRDSAGRPGWKDISMHAMLNTDETESKDRKDVFRI